MEGIVFVVGFFVLSLVLLIPGYIISLIIRWAVGCKGDPSVGDIRFTMLAQWVGLFIGVNKFGFSIYALIIGVIFQVAADYSIIYNRKNNTEQEFLEPPKK